MREILRQIENLVDNEISAAWGDEGLALPNLNSIKSLLTQANEEWGIHDAETTTYIGELQQARDSLAAKNEAQYQTIESLDGQLSEAQMALQGEATERYDEIQLLRKAVSDGDNYMLRMVVRGIIAEYYDDGRGE